MNRSHFYLACALVTSAGTACSGQITRNVEASDPELQVPEFQKLSRSEILKEIPGHFIDEPIPCDGSLLSIGSDNSFNISGGAWSIEGVYTVSKGEISLYQRQSNSIDKKISTMKFYKFGNILYYTTAGNNPDRKSDYILSRLHLGKIGTNKPKSYC